MEEGNFKQVKTSKGGIDYLHAVLLEKPQTITRASLWKIPHHHPENNEIAVKLGRYKKQKGLISLSGEELETSIPKSELTLQGDEFQALIDFIQQEYEPFSLGIHKFIPLDEDFDTENLEHLQSFFANPQKQELSEYIFKHNIIPEDLMFAFNQLSKINAIKQFEEMLNDDKTEHEWQKWFQLNSWVLGSEYVEILDERNIDTKNITDFLMKAYDGFLDMIEIKRPDGNLNFWHNTKDHDNYVPHQDLVKAITQASKYIYEIEREMDSNKFRERIGGVKTIKPRCVLIFGRSSEWNEEQKESFRILNSNYHNLTIMSYDHVLERAKRIIN